MSRGRQSFIADAGVLVAATIAARALLIWALPDSAMTVDLKAWAHIAELLEQGLNPYAVTDRLNGPPFWMQVIYFLSSVSRQTGIAMVDLARWLLIAVEAVNVTLMVLVAAELGIEHRRRLLLFGVALNPISMFLVAQHGNFDAFVVMAMLCFALALLHHQREGDPVDWLMASFALGIGVLIKIVPFVLLPVLFVAGRSLPMRIRFYGAVLFATPAAIGLSTIYVLAPAGVTDHVLRYRAIRGWFGITGLLDLAGLETISAIYVRGFAPVLLAALAAVMWKVRVVSPRQQPLFIAALLLALITLGPGFGDQYLAWPLPFLVLTKPLFDAQWSRDLIVLWITVSLTSIASYALAPALGSFLLAGAPTEGWPELLRDLFSEPAVVTLLRLPMFAAMLWMLAEASARLRSA